MNTFSFKRIASMFFILAGSAIIIVVLFSPKLQTEADEARLVLEKNDILSLAETVGTKNLTNLGNVKFLFDEKDGFAVFGQGWDNKKNESEMAGGTQLWLLNIKTNQKTQLVKEFEVTEAILGNNGTVYYTTRDQDLFAIDPKGTARKIKEKVLQISISNDSKMMIYQKLPTDWQTGDYYDGALGLTILNLNTLVETRLTNKWEDWGAFFSPNNLKIMFISTNEYGMASFFSINTDGTNRIQMTNISVQNVSGSSVPTPSERPVFSTDAKYLAFEADRTIWAMELNPEMNKVLQAKKIAYGVDPKFSKDGKYLNIIVLPTENSKRAVIQIDLENAMRK
ncbi:hypothetical protein HZC21_04235 [Candidatus Peregrinibacteria bacterium]|nr:hypothetical protein [Candidatus Peregrinibacteria bacterium]